MGAFKEDFARGPWAPAFRAGQVQPDTSLEGGCYLLAQLAQRGHIPSPQKAAARLKEALAVIVQDSAEVAKLHIPRVSSGSLAVLLDQIQQPRPLILRSPGKCWPHTLPLWRDVLSTAPNPVCTFLCPLADQPPGT